METKETGGHPGHRRTHTRKSSNGRGPGPGPGPGRRTENRAPDSPAHIPGRRWWAVLRRTGKEFLNDELIDHAAALTYYAVLSIFPALLAVVSLLGVTGKSVIDKILASFDQFAPGPARDIMTSVVEQVQKSDSGGLMAVLGLLGALWSSSGYVGSFMRSANTVYDMPEGRPLWKATPIRVGLTVALMAMACVSAAIVVFTGSLAKQLGTLVGLTDTALTVWSFAKWPVLALLAVAMIALLYWVAPNVKGHGIKWVSPGGGLALLVILLTSAGFAWYIANFGSFNKTYGAFSGVIIFLIWLWLTNLALLLGLEFDAEMMRERAMEGGHPAAEEPYLHPRDTQGWSAEEHRENAPGPGHG